MAQVSVPVLVMYGTADQVCFPSHAQGLFDAVPHQRKEIIELRGATHYFTDQPDHVAHAADRIVAWLRDHDLMA